ncbi:MAG TPA: amidohydrolase family protein [Acidimicrobiia bacterium]|jgi:predicted TIM-barrel fold metal-dependent hydrolase
MPDASDRISRIFDADNHYWEASDAFTRHRDPAFAARGLEVKEVDGALRYVVEGEVFRGLPGPGDVHPRPRPGSFMDYFSGKLSRQEFVKSFNIPPSEHPEWYERDARLRVMDDQGVEAVWMFPSQGVVLEAPILERDVEAAIEVVRAFNRWIEDRWGFAYRDRIFGVPYLNMSDPDDLVAELEWCLDHGARVVAIRHGAAVTADGLRSPADPVFDRFWGLAQESGVVVSSHDGADSTYADMYPLLTRVWGDSPDLGAHGGGDNMRMMGGGSVIASLMKNRIVHDFAYILVAHRLFERFPRLKVAYIENGCAWVPALLQALDYLGHGGDYASSPRDQFVEHCWVAPFVEESVDELARHLPVERILFGSDWPHGEGFPEPRDFFQNVAGFSIEEQRRIMYENARELTFA